MEKEEFVARYERWFSYDGREDLKKQMLNDLEAVLNNNQTSQCDKKVAIRSLSDEELLSNALRFAFDKCPKDEQLTLVDFQKYKKTFHSCMKWLRNNYEPTCDGFLEEVVSKEN